MREAIVVGGGFAGLSAAAALSERGVRVTVLEARPTLGGRATAHRDPETGDWVDNGQHVLLGCYHETFAFLRRIGSESLVNVQDDLRVDFVDLDGRRSRLSCPPLPAPLHLVAGVLAWRGLPLADRLSVLRLAPALLRAQKPQQLGTGLISVPQLGTGPINSAETAYEGSRHGNKNSARPQSGSGNSTCPQFGAQFGGTVAEWLRAHGQGARLVEMLWEPLALAALNQPPGGAEARYFVRVLAQMFGRDRRAAALALPTVPLHELYAEPARAFIEARGGLVRTGAPARIVIEQGRVAHVAVRDERLTAEAVICAVPWFALADTIANPTPGLAATLDAASGTAASPIVTVNLWLDRPVLDLPFVGLPGRMFQWVFDKRFAFGETASHLSLVCSGGDDAVAMTNAALVERALAELGAAIPAVHDAVVRRGTAVRERRATFSLAPGQPARPEARTDVTGLVLAGDWLSTGLPATIESAVASGHTAAGLFLSR